MVFRHFPLTEVHPLALPAHEAAEAAGAQGKFWEMHDILFENQPNFDPSSLASYAAALGLDIERFVDDLRTHRYQPRIREDFMSGVRSGVNGTPTLFTNSERFNGLPQTDMLVAAIDSERRQAQAAHPG
jgi:protein-disulfide isomerase